MGLKPGGMRGNLRNVSVGEDPVPGSAVHHWKFDEGVGNTAADSIGSADGTINGPAWINGTWIDSHALNGDGIDDEVSVSGISSSYGSNMDSFGWLFTFQTSTPSDSKMIGMVASNSGSSSYAFAGFTTDWDPANHQDRIQFSMNTGPDISSVQTNSAFNDGKKHRCAITTNSLDPSDVEIWVDGNNENVTQNRSKGNFVTDALVETEFFASPEISSPNHFNGNMDNIIFADSKLTSAEITTDYNNQPWV